MERLIMQDITVIQIAFENWVFNAMPDLDETLLLGFDREDGYTKDDTINAMWVGFCAAYRLHALN